MNRKVDILTASYKDLINVDELYHYSVNIRYDLNNLKKIKAFVPTLSNIDVLKKLLLNTLKKNDKKANVLIGPYGKGKSYILLVLLYILSQGKNSTKRGDENFSVLAELCDRIKSIDSEAADIIEFILSERISYLPVILNYNYRNPEQAFFVALKESMERESLENLRLHTSFELTIETIKKWEESYPEAFEKFKGYLLAVNFTVDEFVKELARYNYEVYEYFTKIYSDITAGAKFNVLLNDDLISTYKSFTYKLREEGLFNGIYIVFDEFSKFIEEAVRGNHSIQLKTIQDMAELIERDTDRSINFSCIMHKPFDHYLKNATSVRVDLFRTIEGRFQEIYFISSMKDEYEVIGQVIKKDEPKFSALWEQYREKVEGLYLRVNNLFKPAYGEVELKNVARKCFPFNPVALYTLPKLCELMAQNERTLFSYMTSRDKGGFLYFIEKRHSDKEVKLLNIDDLFDYFELYFKKEIFNKKVADIYSKTEKALNLARNENEKKILKALSLFYIIDEPERLEPKEELLRISLDMEGESFDKALEELFERKILIKRKSNQFIDFFLSNNVDLWERIELYKSLKVKDLKISEIATKIKGFGFVFPRKYNDEYEMNRYFYRIFMEARELDTIDSYQDLLNIVFADGYIINLLWQREDEIQKAIEKIKQIKDERILLCIPQRPFEKLDEVREYIALQILYEEAKGEGNESLLYDIELLLEDEETLLTNYIGELFDCKNCRFYDYKGELLSIKSERELGGIINRICYEVYDLTPVIPNEMINKNNLTPQIRKALINAINCILEGKMDDIKGNKPEKTIIKATIVNKGLLDGKCKDKELKRVFEEIDSFLSKSSKQKVSFGKLYSVLQGKRYGLRKGIIPVYLAYKMKDLISSAVFYLQNKEIDFEADLFVKINENPESYFVFCDENSLEKESYLEKLIDLFKDYVRENERNRYSKIYNAIRAWYLSLPPFTQVTSDIKVEGQILSRDCVRTFKREIVSVEQNPFEFISHKLLRILESDSYSLAVLKLEKLKSALDLHLEGVAKEVAKKVKDIMGLKKGLDLSAGLKKWYFSLPKTVTEVFHGEPVNSFLKYLDEINGEEDIKIISDLSVIFTGVDINHWEDSACQNFCKKLKEVSDTLTNTREEENISGFYKILSGEKGTNIYKTLEKVPISEMGRVLKNAIEELLLEFGAALDEKEKLNVLASIIEERLS